MARPTKYDPSLINKIPEYFNNVGREQTMLPTRYGFAKFIGVNDDTLVEWEKKYPAFSAAIKEIDDLQKEQLMNDGLYGGKEVNSTMAIFLLKANHGMIETEKKIIEGDGVLIKLDAGNLIQPVKPVSTKTD